MTRILPQHLTAEQTEAIRVNELYEQQGFFMPVQGKDVQDYKQWARDHFQAEFDINPTWHPIIIDECIKIITETYNSI
jgi:hypothetical protein